MARDVLRALRREEAAEADERHQDALRAEQAVRTDQPQRRQQGRFDSLTLISPDDFAALDICYTGGAEVLEQGASLVEDLKKAGADSPPPVPWEQIKKYDGRFDVLHFEQVPEDADEDAEEEEMLDPSALLVVLGAWPNSPTAWPSIRRREPFYDDERLNARWK